MSGGELSSVSYKKGNYMRYTLWSLAAICIGLLIYTFITTLNSDISANIPEGYRFSVTENYANDPNIRTSYYVYEDRILVEKESYDDHGLNRSLVMYDGVDTKNLSYDSSQDAEDCDETNSCKARTKALTSIRKLISRKTGREYVGL